jgi:hypothetical protein
MARLRSTAQHWRYDPESPERLDIYLDLIMGPHGRFTEDQLRIAWEVERDNFRKESRAHPGRRYWGYWKFECGEDPPSEHDLQLPWPEAIRLAELGDLHPDEIAALQERANESQLRINKGEWYEHISAKGTPMERWSDRENVEGWKRVKEALER